MAEPAVVLAGVQAALGRVLDRHPSEIAPHHRLVDDLGVDSMTVASLTIALEDELDDVLLLNDWIAAASNPSELTVASLVAYLVEVLAETPQPG